MGLIVLPMLASARHPPVSTSQNSWDYGYMPLDLAHTWHLQDEKWHVVLFFSNYSDTSVYKQFYDSGHKLKWTRIESNFPIWPILNQWPGLKILRQGLAELPSVASEWPTCCLSLPSSWDCRHVLPHPIALHFYMVILISILFHLDF